MLERTLYEMGTQHCFRHFRGVFSYQPSRRRHWYDGWNARAIQYLGPDWPNHAAWNSSHGSWSFGRAGIQLVVHAFSEGPSEGLSDLSDRLIPPKLQSVAWSGGGAASLIPLPMSVRGFEG